MSAREGTPEQNADPDRLLAFRDTVPAILYDRRLQVLDATPLRRFGSSTDVNRLVVYLLDETNFVTGVCYRVDGGRFLGAE